MNKTAETTDYLSVARLQAYRSVSKRYANDEANAEKELKGNTTRMYECICEFERSSLECLHWTISRHKAVLVFHSGSIADFDAFALTKWNKKLVILCHNVITTYRSGSNRILNCFNRFFARFTRSFCDFVICIAVK